MNSKKYMCEAISTPGLFKVFFLQNPLLQTAATGLSRSNKKPGIFYQINRYYLMILSVRALS